MKRKGEYADRRWGVSMSCIHDQLMFVCLFDFNVVFYFDCLHFIFFGGLSVKGGGVFCFCFLYQESE